MRAVCNLARKCKNELCIHKKPHTYGGFNGCDSFGSCHIFERDFGQHVRECIEVKAIHL